jgi:TatD DNase family protein
MPPRALFDAHCHLQDPRVADAAGALAAARAAGVATVACCGRWPGDWDEVLALAAAHRSILPQLGVHPRWLDRAPDAAAWLPALRARLEAHPHAGVGECGLDHGPRAGAPRALQLAAFEAQLRLAQQLGRPVSVHCVRAVGAVHEALVRLDVGVPVVLHAWPGSAEATRALAAARPSAFFSLGGHLAARPPARAIAAARAVPADRLLLESDAPDGALRLSDAWAAALPAAAALRSAACARGAAGAGAPNAPAAVADTLALVAAARGETEADVAAATRANAARAFAACLGGRAPGRSLIT